MSISSAPAGPLRRVLTVDSGPQPASPIRVQLRQATAALHEEIEQKLDLTRLSMDRYLLLLQAFYGFHAPVEARIASCAPVSGFAWPARAALLERDLLAAGSSPSAVAQLPRCADLPALTSTGDRAGCLYVLEGACLGGQFIARGLEQRFGLGLETGAAFFIGEGAGTAARWSQVMAWIDGLARAGAPPAVIVDSACATFRALLRWSQARGAARA